MEGDRNANGQRGGKSLRTAVTTALMTGSLRAAGAQGLAKGSRLTHPLPCPALPCCPRARPPSDGDDAPARPPSSVFAPPPPPARANSQRPEPDETMAASPLRQLVALRRGLPPSSSSSSLAAAAAAATALGQTGVAFRPRCRQQQQPPLAALTPPTRASASAFAFVSGRRPFALRPSAAVRLDASPRLPPSPPAAAEAAAGGEEEEGPAGGGGGGGGSGLQARWVPAAGTSSGGGSAEPPLPRMDVVPRL